MVWYILRFSSIPLYSFYLKNDSNPDQFWFYFQKFLLCIRLCSSVRVRRAQNTLALTNIAQSSCTHPWIQTPCMFQLWTRFICSASCVVSDGYSRFAGSQDCFSLICMTPKKSSCCWIFPLIYIFRVHQDFLSLSFVMYNCCGLLLTLLVTLSVSANSMQLYCHLPRVLILNHILFQKMELKTTLIFP